MRKDQRELLTQEYLRKDLSFHHKAEGISLIGLAVAMGALCLFLSIIFLAVQAYWQCAVFVGVFGLLAVYLAVNYFVKKKQLDTCQFLLEKDVVVDLSEEVRSVGAGKGRHYKIDYVIHFQENGKKVTSKDEYSRTSVDDVFYIVKIQTKSAKAPKQVATYSARAYRSPEDEDVRPDDEED